MLIRSIRRVSKPILGQPTTEWADFQKWIEKWDKIMATFTGALILVFLLAIFVVNINTHNVFDESISGTYPLTNDNYGTLLVSGSVFCTLKEDPCTVDCMSSSDYTVIGSVLEGYWNEHKSCEENYIKLILRSGFFPNFLNLSKNWFNGNVRLSSLELYLSNMDSIEPDAFTHTAFETVTNLTLEFCRFNEVKSGILNGLNSLKRLSFPMSYMRGFQAGILNDVRNTLEYFSLVEGHRTNNPIQINELFNGLPLTALKTVIIQHNLKESLTARSLTALGAIETLDLSSCQLTKIGNGTFDQINVNVESINLNLNKLTTIPMGLFDRFLFNSNFKVDIDRNEWQCDCNLIYFKELLLNCDIFNGIANCKTPSTIGGRPIRTTDFCDELVSDTSGACKVTNETTPPISSSSSSTTKITTEVTPEITPEITPETTPEITTPTTNDPDQYWKQKCKNADKTEYLEIKRSNQNVKVTNLNNGNVLIELEKQLDNMALIWFNGGNNLDRKTDSLDMNNMNCLNTNQTSVVLNGFQSNLAYTICLMDKTELLITPFDCVSLYIPSSKSVMWISDDLKGVSIGLTVLGILLTLLLGITIGIVTVRKFPFWLRGTGRVIVVDNPTFRKSEVFVMPQGWEKQYHLGDDGIPYCRLSEMSIYAQRSMMNASVTGNIGNAKKLSKFNIEKSPPLPPRPPSNITTMTMLTDTVDYSFPYTEIINK